MCDGGGCARRRERTEGLMSDGRGDGMDVDLSWCKNSPVFRKLSCENRGTFGEGEN